MGCDEGRRNKQLARLHVRSQLTSLLHRSFAASSSPPWANCRPPKPPLPPTETTSSLARFEPRARLLLSSPLCSHLGVGNSASSSYSMHGRTDGQSDRQTPCLPSFLSETSECFMEEKGGGGDAESCLCRSATLTKTLS